MELTKLKIHISTDINKKWKLENHDNSKCYILDVLLQYVRTFCSLKFLPGRCTQEDTQIHQWIKHDWNFLENKKNTTVPAHQTIYKFWKIYSLEKQEAASSLIIIPEENREFAPSSVTEGVSLRKNVWRGHRGEERNNDRVNESHSCRCC